MSGNIVRRVSTLPGNAPPRAKALDRLEIDRDAYQDAFTNGRASWFELQAAAQRLANAQRRPGLH